MPEGRKLQDTIRAKKKKETVKPIKGGKFNLPKRRERGRENERERESVRER
jgi:hypothetical protein